MTERNDLIERARGAWEKCSPPVCWRDPESGRFVDSSCQLHAAIARALADYGDERLEAAAQWELSTPDMSREWRAKQIRALKSGPAKEKP